MRKGLWNPIYRFYPFSPQLNRSKADEHGRARQEPDEKDLEAPGTIGKMIRVFSENPRPFYRCPNYPKCREVAAFEG
jgi:ssDNA-binding Zn-finger/Zn-ribbon topoisomerase 1